MRRLASARVEWRPLFLPRQQLNSRVLSFGSPSGWRDQMTFCIGRRNFITLLGGAAPVGVFARRQRRSHLCGVAGGHLLHARPQALTMRTSE